MTEARETIRTAVDLVAKYGDSAFAYALEREKAAPDRAAAGAWRQVAQAIIVMSDFRLPSYRRTAA